VDRVRDRPYTLLSCGMSLDGFLDDATDERLLLSNDEDFDRVDELRAGSDAILVGAATVRHDDPRLQVRCPERVARRRTAGLPAQPLKVTVTNRAKLDPDARFFTVGSGPKLVYCASDTVDMATEQLSSVATVIDGGRPVELRRASEDLHARGVRRLMVEGGGEVHPVPHRGAGRRAAAGHRAALRRAPRRDPVRRRRPVPVHRHPARAAGREPADRGRRAAPLRALGAVPGVAMTPASIRARVALPIRLGEVETVAEVVTFDALTDGLEHLAIVLGEPGELPLVRLHSECLTGDVLGSRRCDCGPQLHEAVDRIEARGGYLLYLRQEGRGIGLYAKLDAYRLQERGLDTYDANLALGYAADARDYTAAAQMLHALEVDRLALLTNNPDKAAQLVAHGLDVVERVPTAVHLTASNRRYLSAKANRGSHALELGA
jgi:GTP cyclohydrolase II